MRYIGVNTPTLAGMEGETLGPAEVRPGDPVPLDPKERPWPRIEVRWMYPYLPGVRELPGTTFVTREYADALKPLRGYTKPYREALPYRADA